MKIKVLLKVLDKHNLLFKVLWMDERFRARRSSIFAANGIEIKSCGYPMLYSSLDAGTYTIYLQGSDSEQDDRMCVAYVEDAHVERRRIIAALEDWALNWEGFKDPDLKKEDFVDDIYCI